MTAMQVYIAPMRRPGERGVHSLDHFALTVSDLNIARSRYPNLGLKMQEEWSSLGMCVHNAPHRWGSYCEYACDIDSVPVDCDWDAGDFPPEDSSYIWGPEMPPEFIRNCEAAA